MANQEMFSEKNKVSQSNKISKYKILYNNRNITRLSVNKQVDFVTCQHEWFWLRNFRN